MATCRLEVISKLSWLDVHEIFCRMQAISSADSRSTSRFNEVYPRCQCSHFSTLSGGRGRNIAEGRSDQEEAPSDLDAALGSVLRAGVRGLSHA